MDGKLICAVGHQLEDNNAATVMYEREQCCMINTLWLPKEKKLMNKLLIKYLSNANIKLTVFIQE